MLLPLIRQTVLLTCTLSATMVYRAAAATPPPEKLLPASTLVLLTIPDYAKSSQSLSSAPTQMLIHDPAMKPILDKFLAKWQSEVVVRLEQQFGIQFSNYVGLAEGQVTLALCPQAADAKAGQPQPFVFLVDAGSKSESLKTSLEDLKKKWVDAGRKLKPETLRGVEFSTLSFSKDELESAFNKAFPKKGDKEEKDEKEEKEEPVTGEDSKKKGEPAEETTTRYEWWVGQSGSLLMVGNSAAELEKVLAMQAGTSTETLAEEPNFAPWKASLFEGANYYGWVNVKGMLDWVKKGLQSADAGKRRDTKTATPSPIQLMDLLGLNALRALAYSSKSTSEGEHGEFRLAVPEAERTGLVKMLVFGRKDAAPPAFVPADVLHFNRSRLDLAKMFEVLEETVVKTFPASAGVIKMIMETTGKEKDPNFDLRKSLFGNLGDDYVSYSKAPKESGLEAMSSPPSVHLVGARDGDQLASAIKMLTTLLPTQGGKKDRELLGRKIYQIQTPGSDSGISFTSSEGYLVVAQDDALLDEYLRSSEQKAKPLKDLPGLAADVEKVKGTGTGLFGYINSREEAKMQFATLKKESGSIANWVASIPIASRLGWDEDAKAFSEWVDLSLLPPFDPVAKYFHRTIYAGEFTAEGLEVRFFIPMPPELKK